MGNNRIQRNVLTAALLAATLVSPQAPSLFAAESPSDEAPVVLQSPKERSSYSVGVEVARNFKRQNMDIDFELLILGMQDAMKGGEGPRPSETDMIECQYRGTLIDGTEVDSTYVTGAPIQLSMDDTKIISGLREGLKLMPAGSKWQFFIPHQLAFGGQGSGRFIGPNCTLVYEVELVSVQPRKDASVAVAPGAVQPGTKQE